MTLNRKPALIAVAVLAAALVIPAPTSAQDASGTTTSDVTTGDLSINYQYLRFGSNGESEGFPFGLQASYVLNLTERYGIVGDFGFSTKTVDESGSGSYNLNFSTYMAGLALRGSDKFSTRLLVGIARVGVDANGTSVASNETAIGAHFQSAEPGFAFGLGGGAIFTEGDTAYFWRITAGWNFKVGSPLSK